MGHLIELDTQVSLSHPDVLPDDEPERIYRYRWKCACGEVGNWHIKPTPAKAARRARNGGARHVAMAERGTR